MQTCADAVCLLFCMCLLQASQPDNDHAPDNAFSPDFNLKQPSMFGSPLTDCKQHRDSPNKHRAALHRNQLGLAAASDAQSDLATPADSHQFGMFGRVDSSEGQQLGQQLQQSQHAAAGTAVMPA